MRRKALNPRQQMVATLQKFLAPQLTEALQKERITALDVGCGTGAASTYSLYQFLKGLKNRGNLRVFGIDDGIIQRGIFRLDELELIEHFVLAESSDAEKLLEKTNGKKFDIITFFNPSIPHSQVPALLLEQANMLFLRELFPDSASIPLPGISEQIFRTLFLEVFPALLVSNGIVFTATDGDFLTPELIHRLAEDKYHIFVDRTNDPENITPSVGYNKQVIGLRRKAISYL